MLSTKKLLYKILERVRLIPTADSTTYTGTFTINPSGYIQLGRLAPTGGVPYAAVISAWDSATGAFSLALSGNTAYLVGTPNVKVTNVSVRYLYFMS